MSVPLMCPESVSRKVNAPKGPYRNTLYQNVLYWKEHLHTETYKGFVELHNYVQNGKCLFTSI